MIPKLENFSDGLQLGNLGWEFRRGCHVTKPLEQALAKKIGQVMAEALNQPTNIFGYVNSQLGGTRLAIMKDSDFLKTLENYQSEQKFLNSLANFSNELGLNDLKWEIRPSQRITQIFKDKAEAIKIAHDIAFTLNLEMGNDIEKNNIGLIQSQEGGTRVAIWNLPQFKQTLESYQTSESYLTLASYQNEMNEMIKKIKDSSPATTQPATLHNLENYQNEMNKTINKMKEIFITNQYEIDIFQYKMTEIIGKMKNSVITNQPFSEMDALDTKMITFLFENFQNEVNKTINKMKMSVITTQPFSEKYQIDVIVTKMLALSLVPPPSLELYQNKMNEIIEKMKNLAITTQRFYFYQELNDFTDDRFYKIVWEKNFGKYITQPLEADKALRIADTINKDLNLKRDDENSVGTAESREAGRRRVVIPNVPFFSTVLQKYCEKRKKLFSEMPKEVNEAGELLSHFCQKRTWHGEQIKIGDNLNKKLEVRLCPCSSISINPLIEPQEKEKCYLLQIGSDYIPETPGGTPYTQQKEITFDDIQFIISELKKLTDHE